MIVGVLLATTLLTSGTHSAGMKDEMGLARLEVVQSWTLHHHPEAVYSPEGGGYAYISDMDRLEEGEARAMEHALHRVNLDTGEVDWNWAEAGVERPLGIIAYGTTLYVVEGTNSIALYDIDTGARLNRYRVGDIVEGETPSFFNDLAVSPEGQIFVTDMRRSRIYALNADGSYRLLAEDPELLHAVNGLDWYQGRLLAVTSRDEGRVLSLDPMTGEITQLAQIEGESFDGIYQDGRGGVFISAIPGKIYHMNDAHEMRVVEDFVDQNIMANSIGGFDHGNHLLVPHYEGGTVTHYAVSYRE